MSAPETELCAKPREWPNSCAATAKRLVPERQKNRFKLRPITRLFILLSILFYFRYSRLLPTFFGKKKAREIVIVKKLSKEDRTKDTFITRGTNLARMADRLDAISKRSLSRYPYIFSCKIYDIGRRVLFSR